MPADALHGDYFDGVRASAVPVTVSLGASGELHIRGALLSRRVQLAECRISAPLGSTPRTIGLPDGATVETADVELLAHWEAAWGRARGARFADRLASRWRTVLVAAGVVALFAVAAIRWGLPAAARVVAFNLPPKVSIVIGNQAQPTLERLLDLRPSGLSAERRAGLQASFAELVSEAGSDDFEYELQFRHAPGLGPNALALPSGTIVLTDELVALAERDAEILAVLAHEVAHVEQRHGLRSALQDSGVAFVLGTLLGDLSSVTALGASLPRILTQAGYSRDFEREADRGAAAWCRSQGWGTAPMRDILQRLARESAGGSVPWLASHPDTNERVRALDE